MFAASGPHGAFGDQPGKFSRLCVVAAHLAQGIGLCLRAGFANAGTAKEHHCTLYAALIHLQLWLQQLQLQPHGPKLLTAEEIGIGKGQPVGRRLRLRAVGHMAGAFDILMASRSGLRSSFIRIPVVSEPELTL